MSDTKLRDLERRWKETGTVEDEAAYLLERVRAGDLSRESLELAAYCGNDAAHVATGAEPPVGSKNLSRWVRGLKPWGEEAYSRAAVVAAFHVLRLCEVEPTSPLSLPRDAARLAINAAVDAILDGSRVRTTELDRRAQRLAWPGQAPPMQSAMWAALAAGARLEGAGDEDRLVCSSRAAVEASRSVGQTESSVQSAISERLIPWALGRSDPLPALRVALASDGPV